MTVTHVLPVSWSPLSSDNTHSGYYTNPLLHTVCWCSLFHFLKSKDRGSLHHLLHKYFQQIRRMRSKRALISCFLGTRRPLPHFLGREPRLPSRSKACQTPSGSGELRAAAAQGGSLAPRAGGPAPSPKLSTAPRSEHRTQTRWMRVLGAGRGARV